jgi:hypothetical protein
MTKRLPVAPAPGPLEEYGALADRRGGSPNGEQRPSSPRIVGKGKSKPPVGSWPEALRKVRGWLEPYVMLLRYCWRAFTDLPPPRELEALLERVYSGRGLYLYAR